MKKIIMMILAVLSICGCSMNSKSNDFCNVYEPIFYNPDLPKRITSLIDKNNVTYVKKCL